MMKTVSLRNWIDQSFGSQGLLRSVLIVGYIVAVLVIAGLAKA